MHSENYKIWDNFSKIEVLDTGELKLPNGKVIGHRQYKNIYKQYFTKKDKTEKEVMKKLAIEYN